MYAVGYVFVAVLCVAFSLLPWCLYGGDDPALSELYIAEGVPQNVREVHRSGRVRDIDLVFRMADAPREFLYDEGEPKYSEVKQIIESGNSVQVLAERGSRYYYVYQVESSDDIIVAYDDNIAANRGDRSNMLYMAIVFSLVLPPVFIVGSILRARGARWI